MSRLWAGIVVTDHLYPPQVSYSTVWAKPLFTTVDVSECCLLVFRDHMLITLPHRSSPGMGVKNKITNLQATKPHSLKVSGAAACLKGTDLKLSRKVFPSENHLSTTNSDYAFPVNSQTREVRYHMFM